jgi:hypothetical protein
MDALSQLSYTPLAIRYDLRIVRRTSIILTNLPMKFHCAQPFPARKWKTYIRMSALCLNLLFLARPEP